MHVCSFPKIEAHKVEAAQGGRLFPIVAPVGADVEHTQISAHSPRLQYHKLAGANIRTSEVSVKSLEVHRVHSIRRSYAAQDLAFP